MAAGLYSVSRTHVKSYTDVCHHSASKMEAGGDGGSVSLTSSEAQASENAESKLDGS